MNRKVFGSIGLFIAAVLIVLSTSVAEAATPQYRGFQFTVAHTGIRAIMSAGTATGSPPNFYFPAKSPDVYQKFAQEISPKNSPLLIEVSHNHVSGSGTTQNRLYFRSVCDGSAAYYDLSDSTVRGAYVKNVSYNDTGMAFQDDVVDVRVWKDGSTWRAEVFNNIVGYYQSIKTATCTYTQTGWADIVDYGDTQSVTMACPTMYPWGILQIRGIQLLKSSWTLITSSDVAAVDADTWPCINTNNYMITSPYQYQLKLLPYGVGY